MTERYETFTSLIARISRNIRKIKNQEMADYDLRSVHISCLYYLHLQEGLCAAELCEKCDEDKATISRCLDYLEQKGKRKAISDKQLVESIFEHRISNGILAESGLDEAAIERLKQFYIRQYFMA